MSREDQYSIGVSIDNVDYGVWDKLSGGDIDSNETKYKPGAMADEVSLGGSKMVSNVVVSRLYKLDRDHIAFSAIKSRVGFGVVTVTKQPLDVNKVAFGSPIVYRGILKTVNPPDADSEGTGAALISLEVSSAATVG